MINGFSEWAAAERLIQSSPLEQLKGRCVAIDAVAHIQKSLTKGDTKESLLPALGGNPFNIENTLDTQIKQFRDSGIKPLFVFHGINASGEHHKLITAELLAKKIDEAWDLYNASNPDQAVVAFGTACLFDSEHIYRYVQSLLHRKRVPFLVAPYSAYAQIAYMEGDVVDAIQGSSELLVFNTQKVILDMDFESMTFTWVTRQSCIDNLALGNAQLWNDACLLAGSNLLLTLPQLDNDATAVRIPKIRAAADMLKRLSMSGNTICLQHADEPLNRQFDYLDNYRKAIMSIQHHVITTISGEMVTLNKETAPNDVHSFIGQRLPDEIYYYVSRGTLGTSVLSWRTSGQIVEKPPVDGGTSITYQTLIRDKLLHSRRKSLALLSQSLHRFYQHKDVNLKLFFGPQDTQGIPLDVTNAGDVKAMISKWHVGKPLIANRMKQTKVDSCSLLFAIESLSSTDFAKSTITPKKAADKIMRDVQEIQSNALWRYLHLNDYIADDHTLSERGQMLSRAYAKAKSSGLETDQFDEPLLLGVELLRLQILNTDNLFPVPPYHGAPYRGSETDQRNTLLVSRVACLGRLRHEPIGYTGPLSRHLLAYNSCVSAARHAQRDMLDMSLCTMLLDGDVDRSIGEKAMRDIGFGLPFIRDNDCGLSIAVKHYLDELSADDQPTSSESRQSVKDKGKKTWFPHVIDFEESLQYAFSLWDAMTAAVKDAPTSLVSANLRDEWMKVDTWLSGRR
ncbi:hypothetical protein CAC42_2560 [Sphaceloma murrayae]|uniref:XPG N-terminal domain-containing protein n=1 Tax=Sphaceloma murrayae TaxID=2082308 RepID=A0A2K1QWV5_9PEZI|nr:hypothetical protein CAC42_2560 [Sphaceloma murrayae]